MPTPRKYLIFGVMAFGQFMALFDIQIVSASLMMCRRVSPPGPDEVSWVQTAYLMAELVMIPLSGYALRKTIMRLAILLAVTALAGCTVGPDYHRPAIALSEGFHTPVMLAPANPRWWTSFADPVLDQLVEQALAGNLDIAAAAARVEQGRAAAREAGAALLPRADLAASAERDRQSLRTPVGAVSNRLGLPRSYSLYQIGGEASWEVDLFGGLRRGREAARAEFGSAAADADAIRLSIAAETADAYLQLRGLQARFAVASRQLATERQLLALVQQQSDQGIVADRDLNRVRGEAEGIEASLAPLRAAIAGQLNRLAVLTGRQAGLPPAELVGGEASIPIAPEPGGSSYPAELMRRRPDLVAAERRVAAANARIGVALAEYYPHISLSGLAGVASIGTGGLFTGSAFQAGGTGALRWRLFDFGRVDTEVAQARGRQAEALAQYRGTVLRATEDVETALARLAEGRGEIAVREQQIAALTRARDQARQAYQGGVLALVDVLDADRALLEASDRLATARAETARASVAAIRVLGGGWTMRS
jgi:NodT family efflux transporter outer membrane factor (OMF) lipoprotein